MKANIKIVLLLTVLNAASPAWRLCGAEVKARVIDGLGRPILEAAMNVELKEKMPDGKVVKVHWLKLSSNRDGLVSGSFDETLISVKDVQVYVRKQGYDGYSTGLQTEYLLQRQFASKDVRRIARLAGEVQRTELRELLAGKYESGARDESLNELSFLYYRNLRPSLRALVQDPKIGMRAAAVIGFIGVPEDLLLVVQHAAPPKREFFKDRWAYSVVCGLLEPATDEEWAFLKKCAVNDYDDLWVDAGAINILRLVASPRSLEILQEARKINTERGRMIARAIEYIEAKPPPLSRTNLVEAGKAVAQAIKIGNWEGNKEPRLNDEEDMALIDCEFIAGRDQLIHTATFHRVRGVWKLRGVRETSQSYMANPPNRKAFIGAWHGYSEGRVEFARLELKEDGTGLLAISYSFDSPARTYRVKQWSQRRFNLDIVVEPAEPEAESVSLENVMRGSGTLEFDLHGKTWNRKMVLMNESEFQNRAAEAKKTLEGILKPK